MKRSGFKQKKTTPMRRTRLRKKSKQSISKVQRDIWQECRRIIKEKYGNVCYTCGAKGLTSSNWQTGHLFPKASLGAYLKYDLRVLRPQCFRCNINLGGNGAMFLANMRILEGDEYIQTIINDRRRSVKAYDWYVQLLDQYKNYELK